jgi:hypothetical protein
MRRTHLRGHANILKRLLVHTGGFNLGLCMRTRFGIGTPRGLQGRWAAVLALLVALWTHVVNLGEALRPTLTDHGAAFTPHHRFVLLPVHASERAL